MAVVTIAHALYPADVAHPILTEKQTYILLSAQSGSRKTADPDKAPLPVTTKRVVPDDTLLFQ
jgi:3-methylfumaryl-CoA hydratase